MRLPVSTERRLPEEGRIAPVISGEERVSHEDDEPERDKAQERASPERDDTTREEVSPLKEDISPEPASLPVRMRLPVLQGDSAPERLSPLPEGDSTPDEETDQEETGGVMLSQTSSVRGSVTITSSRCVPEYWCELTRFPELSRK